MDVLRTGTKIITGPALKGEFLGLRLGLCGLYDLLWILEITGSVFK